MYDEDKPLGPNALADLAEDRAFHERKAELRRKLEQPSPRPDTVTRAEMQKELDGLTQSIAKGVRVYVVTPFEKRLAQIEHLEKRLEKRLEEHLAARLQQAREHMRLDLVKLLRSAGANDGQVLDALAAFDQETTEETKH